MFEKSRKLMNNAKRLGLLFFSALLIVSIGLAGKYLELDSLFLNSDSLLSLELPITWRRGRNGRLSILFANISSAANSKSSNVSGIQDPPHKTANRNYSSPEHQKNITGIERKGEKELVLARERMLGSSQRSNKKSVYAFLERERRPKPESKSDKKLAGARTIFAEPIEYDCDSTPSPTAATGPEPTPTIPRTTLVPLGPNSPSDDFSGDGETGASNQDTQTKTRTGVAYKVGRGVGYKTKTGTSYATGQGIGYAQTSKTGTGVRYKTGRGVGYTETSKKKTGTRYKTGRGVGYTETSKKRTGTRYKTGRGVGYNETSKKKTRTVYGTGRGVDHTETSKKRNKTVYGTGRGVRNGYYRTSNADQRSVDLDSSTSSSDSSSRSSHKKSKGTKRSRFLNEDDASGGLRRKRMRTSRLLAIGSQSSSGIVRTRNVEEQQGERIYTDERGCLCVCKEEQSGNYVRSRSEKDKKVKTLTKRGTGVAYKVGRGVGYTRTSKRGVAYAVGQGVGYTRISKTGTGVRYKTGRGVGYTETSKKRTETRYKTGRGVGYTETSKERTGTRYKTGRDVGYTETSKKRTGIRYKTGRGVGYTETSKKVTGTTYATGRGVGYNEAITTRTGTAYGTGRGVGYTDSSRRGKNSKGTKRSRFLNSDETSGGLRGLRKSSDEDLRFDSVEGHQKEDRQMLSEDSSGCACTCPGDFQTSSEEGGEASPDFMEEIVWPKRTKPPSSSTKGSRAITCTPTRAPTSVPRTAPEPTPSATLEPSSWWRPSEDRTPRPTPGPTESPTESPSTASPTSQPTPRSPGERRPSEEPTSNSPTSQPTPRSPGERRPSEEPSTNSPTSQPTPRSPGERRPSEEPTSNSPTSQPTPRSPGERRPSEEPSTNSPTSQPTPRSPGDRRPSEEPTSNSPTSKPVSPGERRPSEEPPAPAATSNPTNGPTQNPTIRITDHPSLRPTPQPTSEPTRHPTPRPTNGPTLRPTPHPTDHPTLRPTPQPTSDPTRGPTPRPTPWPTHRPTTRPTWAPTPEPTPEPSTKPNLPPTLSPTSRATPSPTSRPTPSPTSRPTPDPTRRPTPPPTPEPSRRPTPRPTPGPTNPPTPKPTWKPTHDPTRHPTRNPTPSPTSKPTSKPTPQPTRRPSFRPTPYPTPSTPHTEHPTRSPSTEAPTTSPPTHKPTQPPSPRPTPPPTSDPTRRPTARPTPGPTNRPTSRPTWAPTPEPTPEPSAKPTLWPTPRPTSKPTPSPTSRPTPGPTSKPTTDPTRRPTPAPTPEPSRRPTPRPTPGPTNPPTPKPTWKPTHDPTRHPSSKPTRRPTNSPTSNPSPEPSLLPSRHPTKRPTTPPSPYPTPTSPHTNHPTALPSAQPSDKPSPAPISCDDLIEKCPVVCFEKDESDPLPRCSDDCDVLPLPSSCSCCPSECTPDNPMFTESPDGSPADCAPTMFPSPQPSVVPTPAPSPVPTSCSKLLEQCPDSCFEMEEADRLPGCNEECDTLPLPSSTCNCCPTECSPNNSMFTESPDGSSSDCAPTMLPSPQPSVVPTPGPSPLPTSCSDLIEQCPESCFEEDANDRLPSCNNECDILPLPSTCSCCPSECSPNNPMFTDSTDGSPADCAPTMLPSPQPSVVPTPSPSPVPTSCSKLLEQCPDSCFEMEETDRLPSCDEECDSLPLPFSTCNCCPTECNPNNPMFTESPDGSPADCAPTMLPSPQPSVVPTMPPSPEPTNCSDLIEQCPESCFEEDANDRLASCNNECDMLPLPSTCSCCPSECSPDNPMFTDSPDGSPADCAPTMLPSPQPSVVPTPAPSSVPTSCSKLLEQCPDSCFEMEETDRLPDCDEDCDSLPLPFSTCNCCPTECNPNNPMFTESPDGSPADCAPTMLPSPQPSVVPTTPPSPVPTSCSDLIEQCPESCFETDANDRLPRCNEECDVVPLPSSCSCCPSECSPDSPMFTDSPDGSPADCAPTMLPSPQPSVVPTPAPSPVPTSCSKLLEQCPDSCFEMEETDRLPVCDDDCDALPMPFSTCNCCPTECNPNNPMFTDSPDGSPAECAPTMLPSPQPSVVPTLAPSPVPTSCSDLIEQCPDSCFESDESDRPPACDDECDALPLPRPTCNCCPTECSPNNPMFTDSPDGSPADCTPTMVPSPQPSAVPSTHVPTAPPSPFPTPTSPHTNHPTRLPSSPPSNRPSPAPTSCAQIVEQCPSKCFDEKDAPPRCSDPNLLRDDCNVLPIPSSDCSCCPDECSPDNPMFTESPDGSPADCAPTMLPSPQPSMVPTPAPSPVPTSCSELLEQCPNSCFESDESDRLPSCGDECDALPLPSSTCNCCPTECNPNNPMFTESPDGSPADCAPTMLPSPQPSVVPTTPPSPVPTSCSELIEQCPESCFEEDANDRLPSCNNECDMLPLPTTCSCCPSECSPDNPMFTDSPDGSPADCAPTMFPSPQPSVVPTPAPSPVPTSCSKLLEQCPDSCFEMEETDRLPSCGDECDALPLPSSTCNCCPTDCNPNNPMFTDSPDGSPADCAPTMLPSPHPSAVPTFAPSPEPTNCSDLIEQCPESCFEEDANDRLPSCNNECDILPLPSTCSCCPSECSPDNPMFTESPDGSPADCAPTMLPSPQPSVVPYPAPSPVPASCSKLLEQCPDSCFEMEETDRLPVCDDDCDALPLPSSTCNCCPTECNPNNPMFTESPDGSPADCAPTMLPSPQPSVVPTFAPSPVPTSCSDLIEQCPESCFETDANDRLPSCNEECDVMPLPSTCSCCPSECSSDNPMFTKSPDGSPADCAPTMLPSPQPSASPSTGVPTIPPSPYPTPTAPHTSHPTKLPSVQPSDAPSPAPTTCAKLIEMCPSDCFDETDTTLPRCSDSSIQREDCNVLPFPGGDCNCCPDECFDSEMEGCQPTSMPSPIPSAPPTCGIEERIDDVCDGDTESLVTYYQHDNNQAPPSNPIHSIEFGNQGSTKTVSFKVANPFEETHDIYTHYETVGFGNMQCENNRNEGAECQRDISITAKCNSQSQTLVHIYAVGKQARESKESDSVEVPECCMAEFDEKALPEDTVIWTYTIDCECDLNPADCFCGV